MPHLDQISLDFITDCGELLLLGYLLGQIPFGLILTKLAGYGDIRAIGSGNIGATNVLRTGNKMLAILTLLLDAGKGAAAVELGMFFVWAASLGEWSPLHYSDMPFGGAIAGMGALLGHVFPVFLRFKGGKGVATALGVILVLSWPVGLVVAATWLAVALLFRISSLAAIIATASAPVWAWLLGASYSFVNQMANDRYFLDQSNPLQVDHGVIYAVLLMSALVLWRHHANIRRLLAGTEPRIGAKPAPVTTEAGAAHE